MRPKNQRPSALLAFALILVSLACATLRPTPPSISTPEPTATGTATATNTPRPSPTFRATRTPDFPATQLAEELIVEVETYYEKGYLTTAAGEFKLLNDFIYESADLGRYRMRRLQDAASDFFLSAHFKWDSASDTSNVSGCGFIFGLQPNNDHYAVFLDRSRVYFLITDHTLGYSKPVSPTRGTGRVKFEYPAEADFTLISKGAYAYVLVNGDLAGEYTLAQSRSLDGELGVAVLSGTNKDYGTRCEATKLRLWVPRE